MEKFEFAMKNIYPWQREVLWADALNEFAERNQLLLDNVGISTQREINCYLIRLKDKFKELYTTGNYIEKHKGNSKLTLKGF